MLILCHFTRLYQIPSGQALVGIILVGVIKSHELLTDVYELCLPRHTTFVGGFTQRIGCSTVSHKITMLRHKQKSAAYLSDYIYSYSNPVAKDLSLAGGQAPSRR